MEEIELVEKPPTTADELTAEKADNLLKITGHMNVLAEFIIATTPNCYEKKEVLKKLQLAHKWLERVFEKDWQKDGITY